MGSDNSVPMSDMGAIRAWYEDARQIMLAAGHGPTYEVTLQPGEFLEFPHRLVHATLDHADDWAVVLTFYRPAATHQSAALHWQAETAQCAQLADSFDDVRRQLGSNLVPRGQSQTLIDSLPLGGAFASANDLLHHMAAHVGDRLGLPLILQDPTTPSWASHVSLLSDPTGMARAIVKVYQAPHDALLREVSVLRHLQLRNATEVTFITVGRATVAGHPVAYLVTRAVGGQDLEAHVAAVQDTYLVEQAGRATARLHTHVPPSQAMPLIEEERAAHLAYVRRFIQAPENVLEQLVDKGWMDAATEPQVRQRIEHIIEAYAASPLQTPSLGSPHGDCYAPNFVLNATGYNVTIVDVESMLWSLDPQHRWRPRRRTSRRRTLHRSIGPPSAKRTFRPRHHSAITSRILARPAGPAPQPMRQHRCKNTMNSSDFATTLSFFKQRCVASSAKPV